MPHYKDAENKIHFIDSEEFEHILPAGCVRITDDEAVQLQITITTEVPYSVSRFQARAYLAQIGLFSSVESYMAQLPADNIMRRAWEDAQEFERASHTVAAMAQILSLTDEQLDQMFIAAKAIKG